eukprot:TRINITY_DN13332_c0_g1_i1.p1 TRINITY_DN13332_c0_g1~~TRINITY_DN13332_c0_g1_i1.p1  ORF type:complete len:253 (-),score=46.29 TRINITY_DN13332_c0_g1_i1:87-809(-)
MEDEPVQDSKCFCVSRLREGWVAFVVDRSWWAFFLFVVLPISLCFVCFAFPLDADLSLNSFVVREHNVSIQYDAFSSAKETSARTLSEYRDSVTKRAILSSVNAQSKWQLHVIFFSVDLNKTVITRDVLSVAKKLEEDLQNVDNYTNFCWKDVNEKCFRPGSPLDYFFPSVDIATRNVNFDGKGPMVTHLEDGIKKVIRRGEYQYFDSNFGLKNQYSQFSGFNLTSVQHYLDLKACLTGN